MALPAPSASVVPHAPCNVVEVEKVTVAILGGHGREEWRPFGRWFLHYHASLIAGEFHDERDRILEYIDEYSALNPQYHMLEIDENVRFVKDCGDTYHMKRLIAWFVQDSVDEQFGKCILSRIDEWIQCARDAHMIDEAMKLENFRDIERLLEH